MKTKGPRKRYPVKRIDATKIRWDRFIKKFVENNLRDPEVVYQEVYGCSEASSRPAVSRLLHLSSFQEHFAARLKEALDEEKASLEIRIVKMWITRAFYDIADILNADGSLYQDMGTLKMKGLSCVIDGIDIKPDKDGIKHAVYKLADRDKALSMLKDYAQIINEPAKKIDLNIENAESMAPKIFIVQRRTVEEWQEFYKTITSGGPNQDKQLPSPAPPSSSSLAGQRGAERAISSLQISPPISNTGVKRGEVYYFAENTKSSKK
jgi:hypothetical protein